MPRIRPRPIYTGQFGLHSIFVTCRGKIDLKAQTSWVVSTQNEDLADDRQLFILCAADSYLWTPHSSYNQYRSIGHEIKSQRSSAGSIPYGLATKDFLQLKSDLEITGHLISYPIIPCALPSSLTRNHYPIFRRYPPSAILIKSPPITSSVSW